MALNLIWIIFFLIAFITALIRLLFYGDTDVFKTMVDGVFDSANVSVQIAIGLIGIMALFLGFMNVGEKAGGVRFLSRIIGPFFNRLFPEVPKNHPSMGHMVMNFSANLLGLDNAATPFGLKAMISLQELNPNKDTASNAQIMFMVLHASGLTIIPVSIIAQRAILKSNDPTSIFIPCMITTFAATVVALTVVAIRQRINLFQPVILLWVGGISVLIAGLVYILHMNTGYIVPFSKIFSNGLIMLLFTVFIIGGIIKKINVYEAFIDGAKEGFQVAVTIIPYLVGMLVAISVLRSCGVFDYIVKGIGSFFSMLHVNTDFVSALPTALMRPLSGSGGRAMMIDTMKTYGPDSFPGQLSGIFQGTADSTFYIAALYFGSVGIKKIRYAIPAALIADLAAIVTAIVIAYFFFPH
ncbi:MAG: nucleoside recognition domain-containing protein [Bacteroidota bacterium]|nr:nucleoside recognition domain-containing protein [Bacteroidota bacterium]MDP4211106.1 nucleoside recognition domain-containing protein [Bacteroidota bacterium]MDP4249159.1 nucleoside recognition domain-containing protein [Bacteroidota bacterium]